jgi:hypothetical protein
MRNENTVLNIESRAGIFRIVPNFREWRSGFRITGFSTVVWGC